MTEPTSTGRLWAAVDDLTNPTRPRLTRDDGTVETVTIDSLWTQLADSVGNSAETGTGQSKPGSKPPVATEALALVLLIEWEVAKGCNQHRIPFDHRQPNWVPAALRSYASATVTAQHDPQPLTKQVTSWCSQIRATILRDTTPARRLRGHRCITCGSAGIRTTNSDGDPTIVWPLMLSWSDDGQVRAATCEACGEVFWRGEDLHRLAEQDMSAADGRMSA